ncbi:MAG: cytochrome b/b6 domain-containing protein [Pseudomonadota bacterium]
MDQFTAARAGYDPTTRWLHLGLALTVSYQLFISLVMEGPEPGEPLRGMDALIFESHEWVGVAAFVLALAHLAWSLVGPAPVRWSTMLPLRAAQWRALKADLQSLRRLRLPWREEHSGLSALTHALGLLAVLGSALTGFILFLWLPENGNLLPALHTDREAHEFIATFVWIYWVGHVAIAVLHQLMGHPVFERIRPGGRH